jgi:hypothetical protein
MTDYIVPPPELVQQWIKECDRPDDPCWQEYEQDIAIRAAQWGADQELEACCEWTQGYAECGDSLRAARRPKPPSLKKQALKAVNEMSDCMSAGFVPKRSDLDAIRRALEALPE